MARRLKGDIWLLKLPKPSCNTYALAASRVIIDPGLSTKAAFEAQLAALGLCSEDVEFVLLTHCHADHAANVRHCNNAIIYASLETIEALTKSSQGLFEKLGVAYNAPFSRHVAISGEGRLRLGDRQLLALPTPGHTKDSYSYLDIKERVLFSGDTLFATNYGTPRFFENAIYKASLQKLSTLFGVKLLAPGHGATTKDFSGALKAAKEAFTHCSISNRP